MDALAKQHQPGDSLCNIVDLVCLLTVLADENDWLCIDAVRYPYCSSTRVAKLAVAGDSVAMKALSRPPRA